MRFSIILLFCLFWGEAIAVPTEESVQKERINKLQLTEKPFSELSHQQISEYATKALKIQAAAWKHSESDHFIFHYQLTEVRDRFAKEAEFYYWKIKDDMQLTNDLVDHKSHVFIFQDEARWRQFQANADIMGIAGVCIGHEFFCYYPKQKQKDFSGTAAHEMTHLVFNRFFTGSPPLWLNEGFAEYQSRNAFRSFYSQGLGSIKKDASAVAKLNFLEMTRWNTYPDGDLKPALYVKSQLAVELLVEKGGNKRFVEFVNTMIKNHDFETAFTQHYVEDFQSFDHFLKELIRKEKKL